MSSFYRCKLKVIKYKIKAPYTRSTFYRCRLLVTKFKVMWTPDVDLSDNFSRQWGKSASTGTNWNVWGRSQTAIPHSWGK